MNRQVQRQLDKWYGNFMRENGRYPTFEELAKKAKEIEKAVMK